MSVNHNHSSRDMQRVQANTKTILIRDLFIPVIEAIEKDDFHLFSSLYPDVKTKWWNTMPLLHSVKGYDKGLDFQFYEKILKYHQVFLLPNNINSNNINSNTNANHSNNGNGNKNNNNIGNSNNHNDNLDDKKQHLYQALMSELDFIKRCMLYFIEMELLSSKKFLQMYILLDNEELVRFLWDCGYTITEKQFIKMSLIPFLTASQKAYFYHQEKTRLRLRLERQLLREQSQINKKNNNQNSSGKNKLDDVIHKI
jgi:hypothetical protein